ncbi:hypothetical protein [Kitasatospora sp. NPDC097643]|uniref:hypothetical protein n=1 Tax=Kitasatospora sp. NPDC097643 TaxID=3157230 RepID=UPI003322DAE0
MAGRETPGAFYRHWRLTALDSLDLGVRDTPLNQDEYGELPLGSEAFPRVSLAAVAEAGTHAICAAALGSAGRQEGSVLVGGLVDALRPG